MLNQIETNQQRRVTSLMKLLRFHQMTEPLDGLLVKKGAKKQKSRSQLQIGTRKTSLSSLGIFITRQLVKVSLIHGALITGLFATSLPASIYSSSKPNALMT